MDFTPLKQVFVKNSKTAKKTNFFQHIISKLVWAWNVIAGEEKLQQDFWAYAPTCSRLKAFIWPKFGKIQNRVFKIQNLSNNFVWSVWMQVIWSGKYEFSIDFFIEPPFPLKTLKNSNLLKKWGNYWPPLSITANQMKNLAPNSCSTGQTTA